MSLPDLDKLPTLSFNEETYALKCEKCNSTLMEVDIEHTTYPSDYWLKISLRCKDCGHSKTILDI